MKKDLSAIVNAFDVVSAGLLTTVKTNLANTYKGYFEEKFDDLLNELMKNEIEESEILEYVKNLNERDRQICFSIINKNLNSESKIKSFLLSKILFSKYKNKDLNLDYFHSNLLTNLDLFTAEDFENLKIIFLNALENNLVENKNSIKIHSDNFSSDTYKISIVKLKTIGIIIEDGVIQDWGENGFFHITKSEYFNSLGDYIKEFYSL